MHRKLTGINSRPNGSEYAGAPMVAPGRRGADVADGCIAAERFRTIPARRTGPDIDSSQRIAGRDPGPDALARYNSVHR